MLANARGRALLTQTVTAANFSGPPLIVHGDDLTSEADPRWARVSTFADEFSAPLIGVSWTAGVREDVSSLIAALRYPTYAKCFTPAQIVALGDLRTVNGAGTVAAPCGPILSVCTKSHSTYTFPLWQDAFDLSALLTRAPANHRYGLGLAAIGKNTPGETPTPPVYELTDEFPGDLDRTLRRLSLMWRVGEVRGVDAIRSLLELETTRPGISRWIHPAIYYWVVTEDLL